MTLKFPKQVSRRLLRKMDDGPKRKRLMNTLDDKCARMVKERDGYKCQWPGCSWSQKVLNWCHFKSRKYHAIRWDLDNTVTFCVGHHRYTEANPDEFADFMRLRLGQGRFDSLNLRRRNQFVTSAGNLELKLQELNGRSPPKAIDLPPSQERTP